MHIHIHVEYTALSLFILIITVAAETAATQSTSVFSIYLGAVDFFCLLNEEKKINLI